MNLTGAKAKKANEVRTAIEELLDALESSVQLQSHYARLLNDYDGGQRRAFENANAWMLRLRELKKRAKDPTQ